MKIFVPKNLDLKLPEDLKKYEDYCYYFLHLIFIGKYLQKRENNQGYVQFKARYLQNILSWRRWKIVKNILLEKKVIQCDNKYKIGQKSYGFKFSSEIVDFSKVNIYNKNLEKTIITTDKKIHKETDITKYLKKWLDEIKIDQNLKNEQLFKVKDQDRFMRLSMAISEIEDGNINLSRCDYGRIHTNITYSPKELRKCLLINNKPLIEVDISNCQPLLFCYLYLSNRVYHYGTTTDVVLFREACEGGRLYSVMGEWGFGEIKERFYREVFFGQNYIHTDFTRKFIEVFPNVYSIIHSVKEKDYRFMAQILQRVESELLIDSICSKLSAYPDVPIVTVHDSYLTTADAVPLLTDLIKKEFSIYNLKVAVTFK